MARDHFILVDVSGSFQNVIPYMAKTIEEGVKHFLDHTDYGKVYVIYFTHQIEKVETYGRFDGTTPKIQVPYVSGGSDLLRALKVVSAISDSICSVSILTDGHLPIPETDPGYTTNWIIYDNPKFKASYGYVTHQSIDDLKA